ncbi:MAG: CPBP family intramembrane metalloprotease [Deltaproteobacteria bacterium]|nr:MAG: CPBP family intramembrane metalloprotease [Deltaproteobacteria bacterium]
MTTPKSPLIEVAIFIPLAVLGSWTIFGVLGGPGRWQVVQWVMFWPAIAGFGVAWLFRREPPRAAGFEYTGALPWLAAFFYPLAMVAAEVGLAYALRLDIRFQPEAVGGLNGFEEKLQRTIFVPLTILFIALAYRWRWPERVRDALPPRLRLLHHGFRALLFVPALWIYHFGQLAPPGSYGEELGWRGYLVRRLRETPVRAALISGAVWAAFHAPVLIGHNPLRTAAGFAAIFAGGLIFCALYLWSGSVWPCAAMHFTWNEWNPFFLGDPYGDGQGMFGGASWIFNGEGVFGMALNLLVGAVLLRLRVPREDVTLTGVTRTP